MPTISEKKESLKQTVLDSYREEYKDYADNWRNLETKAQGNIAVAGIFIAGVFAFLTKGNYTPNEYDRFLLLLSIGFLVASIVASIFVLQTRTVKVPPLGSFVDYQIKRILKVDDADFHERVRRFGLEHFNKWREVMDAMDKTVQSKADRLWIAQILLMAAILSIALLTFIKVVAS